MSARKTTWLDKLALLAFLFVGFLVVRSVISPAPRASGSAPPNAAAASEAAPAEAEPKLPTDTDAYYFARRTCEQLLKAPSSAKFSNPNSDANTGWKPDGYLQWHAFGKVDAQNDFGAMLRQNWFAVVQYNTGKLEVVYLRLGEQEIGKQPTTRPAPVQP